MGQTAYRLLRLVDEAFNGLAVAEVEGAKQFQHHQLREEKRVKEEGGSDGWETEQKRQEKVTDDDLDTRDRQKQV